MFTRILAFDAVVRDHRRGAGWIPDLHYEGRASGSGSLKRLSASAPSSRCVHRRVDGRIYRFACADEPFEMASAARLVSRRYAWRGYNVEDSLGHMRSTNELTLVASCAGEVHGTLTVRLDDRRSSLLSEALYPDEIGRLRARGARLCEFGRLAFEANLDTLEILGPLFHLGLIYTRGMNRCTDAVVEVNPRHAGFYRHLFGFETLGEERTCQRVAAPAVLMRLALPEAVRRADAEGGTRTGHRAIYPYCLGYEEFDALYANPAPVVEDRRHATLGQLDLVY